MANVRKSLFHMVTTKGAELSFAVLDNDRCAIMRDGVMVETYLADEASLGRALRQYFKMIEESGGATHPFQVVERSSHPDAG